MNKYTNNPDLTEAPFQSATDMIDAEVERLERGEVRFLRGDGIDGRIAKLRAARAFLVRHHETEAYNTSRVDLYSLTFHYIMDGKPVQAGSLV